MSEVVVKPVRSWFDRRRFVHLPWELYRDDPFWVPPLIHNQKELLGYKRHPFHEQAEVQTFLAWQDGRPVGRVAAILNESYIRHYGERRGFFGYFESIHDPLVATALFDAVKQWFAARDIRSLRGPTNPSMNYECGLLVDGFDGPPMFMMSYNPPWYGELLENCGLKKARDLHAYIGRQQQLPEIETKLGPIADMAAERCQVKIRHMNPKRFLADVATFMEMYNQAMVQTWSFVPFTPGEIAALAKGLKHLMVPELAVVAEDAEGKTVGAIFGLLDYNPRVKQIDGRLFPFGFLTLLKNPRGIKRMRVLSINVLPEYQRWGLGLVLMRGLVPKAMELGIEEAEFSWILEDNHLAQMGLRKGGATIYRTYRIYDYDPPDPAQVRP